MDGRSGGQEGRVPHKEGAQGALGEERGALRWDVLTAPHAVVDLQVQGLVLLLDSGREKRRKEGKVKGKELGMGWWHPWDGGCCCIISHVIINSTPYENSQSLPTIKKGDFH